MCYLVIVDYVSPVTMLSFPINDLVTVAKSKETSGFCLGPNSVPIRPRPSGGLMGPLRFPLAQWSAQEGPWHAMHQNDERMN